MRLERLTRLAVAVVVLAVVTVALLLGTRVVSGLGILTLPVSWPGLIILGADETQERFGYWGELVLFWLCSLPCIFLYAWLFCRWRERRSRQEMHT
jgi:membrane-anchored protein YejM (alkaline phosphatase superfamily)